MVFNPESSALNAEYVDEKAQKDIKMVDLSVLKKGLNFHGTDAKALDKEKADIKNEEAKMERENAMKSKTTVKKEDESEGKPKSTAGSEKQEAEEEREGKLKLIQV